MSIMVRVNGVEHELWSRLHSACKICKTTKQRHIANGLCLSCHARERARVERAKQKASRKRKRKPASSPVMEPPEPQGDTTPEAF